MFFLVDGLQEVIVVMERHRFIDRILIEDDSQV